jgi:hypothetical protein
MNPGAIVEGSIPGTAAGLDPRNVSGALVRANEVSIMKQAPGRAASLSAAASRKNWDEELAEQTSFLAHQSDTLDLLSRSDASHRPDSVNEIDSSSDHSVSEGRVRPDLPGFAAPGMISARSEHRSQSASEGRSSAVGSASNSKSSGETKQRKSHSQEKIAGTLLTPFGPLSHSPLMEIGSQDSPLIGGSSPTSSSVKAEVFSPTASAPFAGLWNAANSSVEGNFDLQKSGSLAAIGSAAGQFTEAMALVDIGQLSEGKAVANAPSSDSPDSPGGGNGIATQPTSSSIDLQSFAPVRGSTHQFIEENSGVTSHRRIVSIGIADSASSPNGLTLPGDVDVRRFHEVHGMISAGISEEQKGDVSNLSANETERVGDASATGMSGANQRDRAAQPTLIANPRPESAASLSPTGLNPLSDARPSAAGVPGNLDAREGSRRAEGQSSYHDVLALADADDSAGIHGNLKFDAGGPVHGSANSGSHSSNPGPAIGGPYSGAHSAGFSASFANSILAEPGAAGSNNVSASTNQSAPQSLGEINRNPFLAMDSEGGAVFQQASSAGTNQLMVGHQDPALGYIELRAHSDSSGVHASLGVQSAATGETLTGHLGSLASWLNERHTPVESLTVLGLNSQHDARPSLQGRDAGANGMTSGNDAGTNTGQGGPKNGDQEDHGTTTDRFLSTPPASSDLAAISLSRGFALGEVLPTRPSGSSISVLA